MGKLRLLRIGIIKEKIGEFEFLVEDIFDKEIVNMTMSGKQRMHYINVEIGDEVFVEISPYEPLRGRLATITSFKMNQELYRQKIELLKRKEDEDIE